MRVILRAYWRVSPIPADLSVAEGAITF
jgi:hypothetical protein